METNDNVASKGGGSSSGGGGGSSSRWNPTKEQLNMLEGLYGEGIRTPSAEQIQSITKRLQIYGHIEGKNVFYWFQNHKARQRQKQKMDQITSANNNNINNNFVVNSVSNIGNAASYFNRFYYPSPPVSPSASAAGGQHHIFQAAPHSVAYSPYYIAQPEFGFYPHYPNMVLPNHPVDNISLIPSSLHNAFHRENITTYATHNASNISSVHSPYHRNGVNGSTQNVTLDLFPTYPTGILRDRDHQPPNLGSITEVAQESASTQDKTPSGSRFDVLSKQE